MMTVSSAILHAILFKSGVAVDMWSIGVIIYTLICGSLPFDADKQKGTISTAALFVLTDRVLYLLNADLFHKIKHAKFSLTGRYWDKVEQPCKDLVAGLLTVDPAQRLTAAQALQMPWLQVKAEAPTDLSENLTEFKRFNGLRKFRKAARMIILANRFRSHDAHDAHDPNDLEHVASDDSVSGTDNQM
jgi:serine/threonine protein kinase